MTACRSGSQDWEHFLHKHAGQGTTIRLNGVMKLGLQLWADADSDPESQEVVRILKKMKGVEVHIFDASRAHVSEGEVNHLTGLLDKSAYHTLLNVRHGGQQVHLWARGKDDAISDPLVLVCGEGKLVLAEMKGTLSADDLHTLVRFGTGQADQQDK
jgi:hypothetical protein